MTYLPLLFVLLGYCCFGQGLEPQRASCEFYLKLEKAKPCITCIDYSLSYGYKYCSLFQEIKNHYSDELRLWMERTTLCLQEKLNEYYLAYAHSETKEYCSGLFQVAFDSHSECYMESGFCHLSYSQKMAIVRQVSSLDVLFNFRPTMKQALLVAVKEVGYITDKCLVQ